MFHKTGKQNNHIADFLTLLHLHSGTLVTKNTLYNEWRYITAYQKKSEKEVRDNFEKLFMGFSQKKTKHTFRPIIHYVTYNTYRIANVPDSMYIKTCYGDKLTVEISKDTISEYGSLKNLRKFAIISFLVQILNYCKNAEFDGGLLQNILGLSKHDIREYFKKIPVVRQIGIQEAIDLELDINAFTLSKFLGWSIQTGFRLISSTGIKFMDFNGEIDYVSMSSIVDRLETKTYCVYKGRWNRPISDDAALSTTRVYQAKRQVTGYKSGGKRSRAYSFIKMLAEVTNLGQLKNCKNIMKNRNKYVPEGSSVTMRNHIVEKTMRKYNHQYNTAVKNNVLAIKIR